MMTKRRRLALLTLLLGPPLLLGAACTPRRNTPGPTPQTRSEAPADALPMTPAQARIVAAARRQIGDSYDASYRSLSYPNGDPPAGRGACTDVVVRGLRAAGIDLQAQVHADMTAHWNDYPHSYGLHRPDPNIDHRRVPNLTVFFRRHGCVLPNAVTPATLAAWQPGDIVCWKLPGGFDHTGLLTDRRDNQGIPFVVHNLGGCQEQDVLTAWTIAGHYRYPK